ncbi:hypothetical protein PV396_22755 [Streptomyces sp. ME02-8801-2C]|nr:hypothetical protein [Streptomyces sp. ME02-8801-2C]
MNKLKKTAAVVAMVGGLGLVGGGVASAHGGLDYDGPVVADNLQVVECEQSFDAGAAFAALPTVATGDAEQKVGNFCSAANPED